MDEQYGKEEYKIYEMPTAKLISSESFTEFQMAYNYMTETEKYKSEIKDAINSNDKKTLIVTEGSTDWRHLMAALDALKKQDGSYAGLNIDFLQYNPKNSNETDLIKLEMSCSHLVTMCKDFAKICQSRKIIFLADADDSTTKKELEDPKIGYKNWNNNVFSLVLPVPEHRRLTPDICIEHYYSDVDIRTPIIVNGIERRIYIGLEFDNVGLSLDKRLMCIDRKSCGEGKIRIIDGQSDKRVFRIDDEKQENLALPKMEFAKAIYNKNEKMINIDFSEFHLIFDIIKKIEELPIEN